MRPAKNPKKVSAARLYFTFLPFMADRIVNGGGKKGTGGFGLYVSATQISGTEWQLSQGAFTQDAGSPWGPDAWRGLGFYSGIPSGDVTFVWTVENDNNSNTVTISKTSAQQSDGWLGFIEVVHGLGLGTSWVDYLPVGNYYFQCEVFKNGKSIGTSDQITVEVVAPTYTVTASSSSQTVNPGDTITITVYDNLYDDDGSWENATTWKGGILPRKFTYAVTDSTNTPVPGMSGTLYESGDIHPVDYSSYAGVGTPLTFSDTVPATILPGTYTLTITGEASNGGISGGKFTNTSQITITVPAAATITANNDLGTPDANGIYTIRHFGTEYNDGELTITGLTGTYTYQWHVIVNNTDNEIEDATANSIELLYVAWNNGDYSYDDTETEPAYLTSGTYKFYAEVFNSSNVSIGNTNAVTINVRGVEIKSNSPNFTSAASNNGLNPFLTITQGAFTGGVIIPPATTATPNTPYSLSFDDTSFPAGTTISWVYSKPQSVDPNGTHNPITETTSSLDLINTLTANEYLEEGNFYAFVANLFSSSNKLIGETEMVMVQVEALPTYAITVTNDDDNNADVDGATISVTATGTINLTVKDNVYDDDTILSREYTWTVTKGSDEETDTETGSGNYGTATIEIDLSAFTTITGLSIGDTLTVTIEAVAENDGLGTTGEVTADPVTFTIEIN